MDPVKKVDATICDPYPVPPQATLDIDFLVASLHKRVPYYLQHFLKDGASKTANPPLSEAMEEDILLLLGEAMPSRPSAQPAMPKEAVSTPAPVGPSVQQAIPSGPSAQPAMPREVVSTPAPAGPSVQREIPIYVKEVHSETSPASSEVEEFITVASKGQKRKLKASKSTANPPKKVPVAATQAPTPACVASPAAESPDSVMVEPPRERIPPLFIRDKNRWEKVIPLLDEQRITFSQARSTAVGIRVQCPDSANHRRLTATLRSENIGFHTYALPDERVIRAVIRGLPKEISPDSIKEDLIAQGLPVQQVHRMYQNRSKQPFDMVLVILDLSPEGKKIWEVRTVCRLSGLKVQEPLGRGRIGQCHNCQLYGHSARNCFAKPRCVMCLGDHGMSLSAQAAGRGTPELRSVRNQGAPSELPRMP